MKKIFAMLLAAMMLFTCAVSYAEGPALAGGWALSDDGELDEYAMDAFNKATANLDGIEPLRLLGTQVVAGLNYSILVRVNGEAGNYFAVLTIYADLTGNATIMDEFVIPLGVQPHEEAEEEIADGQNAVMNFIGEYQDEVSQRAVMTIQAIGEGIPQALITIDWANGADSGVEWVFTCTFDEDTLSFNYDQGVKKNYTANEKGEISYEIVAEGLTGSFAIDENDVITWNASGDDADNGCRFVYVY